MSNTSAPAQPAAPVKTRVEKAHNFLSLVSTGLGICGVAGTLFVWLAANFYVGDLEVRPDRASENLTIKVYDQKGQETVYHTLHFQLMPGTYHLDVLAEGAATMHTQATVHFRQTTVLPVTVSTGSDDEAEEHPAKHHWWEFWR